MRTQVSVKTITEVEPSSGIFLINCFSDMNEDGSTTPAIYKSQVLEKPMVIDNTSGKEGELMMSHSGDTVGSINPNGELVIEVQGDDANRYEKEQENLIYNEG